MQKCFLHFFTTIYTDYQQIHLQKIFAFPGRAKTSYFPSYDEFTAPQELRNWEQRPAVLKTVHEPQTRTVIWSCLLWWMFYITLIKSWSSFCNPFFSHWSIILILFPCILKQSMWIWLEEFSKHWLSWTEAITTLQ